MKTIVLASLAALSLLAGCASTADVPAGMKQGKFVDFSCEGGKRMSARAAEDGSTVRVRFEGGYELDRKAPGQYEADGWKLNMAGGVAQLEHGGKVVAKGCKPV